MSSQGEFYKFPWVRSLFMERRRPSFADRCYPGIRVALEGKLAVIFSLEPERNTTVAKVEELLEGLPITTKKVEEGTDTTFCFPGGGKLVVRWLRKLPEGN